MKKEEIKTELNQIIKNEGFDIENVTLEKGVAVMIELYKNIRVEDCDINQDGDMLLFQWNISADKSEYEIDLTRQFILSDLDADQPISQLHMTYSFKNSSIEHSIENGNIWCHLPEDVVNFQSTINEIETYMLFKSILPENVKIEYELV